MGDFPKRRSERITLNQEKGAIAEEIACKYLQRHGLNLIEKNFRVKCGEIDLIMSDKEYLIFIEVRYRKNNFFCDPMESIYWTKQQRIIRAANVYNVKKQWGKILPSRFDIVSIVGQLTKPEIEWIPDAFWADE